MSIIDGMRATSSAMIAQSMRMDAISSNIANMDTVASSPDETFKAKFVKFKAVAIGGAEGVVVTEVVNSSAPAKAIYAPTSPLADKNGFIYSSNVNREEMVADLMSTESSYQLNAQTALVLKNLASSTIQTLNK